MKESAIQKKILDFLAKEGHYAVKGINMNRAGVPDILACVEGRFWGIEVKKPGGRPSKLQEKHIELIHLAGGVAAIVYSYQELLDLYYSKTDSHRKG